jgi:hypothetical protein
MKCKTAFKKTAVSLLLIFTMGLTNALAYKGAYLRIFNLTGTPVTCEAAEVLRFDNEGGIKNALRGTIDPGTAFPAAGPQYVEERTWLRDADLKLSFSSAMGNPSIRITYRSSYYIYEKNNNGGLYVYGTVTYTDKLNEQYIINIFISDKNFTAANWMSQLTDDVKLCDLLMPGTHDAGTYRWNTVTPMVKTQTLSFTEQLESGVRYFDLRGWADNKYTTAARSVLNSAILGRYKDLKFEDIQVTHGDNAAGKISLLFSEVFEQLYGFLRTHPTESVMLQVKMDYRDGNVFKDDSKVEDVLKTMIAKNSSFFYTANDLPHLGDVRGKIVLINRVHGQGYGFNITDFPNNPEGVSKGRYAIQDNYEKIAQPGKIKAVTQFLNNFCTTPGRLNLNFLSYTIIPAEPLDLANGAKTMNLAGINYEVAKYLNSMPQVIPNWNAVMLMDGVKENDGLALTEILLNYKNHVIVPVYEAPQNGVAYYIRPAIALYKALKIDVAGNDKNAVLYRQHPKNDVWPWQQFTLVQVRDNIYRLRTVDNNKSTPLFLDAFSGSSSDRVVGYKDCIANGCSTTNQEWRIEKNGSSPYVTITSLADGKRLDVIAGSTADNAAIKRYGTNGTLSHQLWVLERVK